MYTINKGFWDKTQQTETFVILGPFLPIDSTNKPKNENFEKMKQKTPGDIIILHLSTTNDIRIMYDSYDMECNRQNIFSFFSTFCPFTKKSKFWKKKTCRYHQLTLVYPKWQWYDVWFLRYKVQQTEFFMDYFLPFELPPPPTPTPPAPLKPGKLIFL